MPRLAANLTMMFTEHPFMNRFAAAHAAGFEAVEFLFPYAHPAEDIARALHDNALTPALFNLPPGDWDAGERGLAALPHRRADFRASVASALAYAEATGTKRLHMMAGLADRTDPAACRAYADALAYLCDATPLTILIEPINRRDMPGYFLDDFTYAAQLIASLGRPNLKLQFDIYHRQILHGDVLTGLRDLMPLIGHIQIAAVPHRHEPTTGELNDAHILRELDRMGYTGFVGCEYRPAAGTLPGLGWRSAV
jgi:2-dehydrotetronate isomerase